MKLIEAAGVKKFGTLRKLENYFAEYDVNFREIHDRDDLKLFEIGVQGGGSLAMWNEYFPSVEITGLDIDPTCKQFERENIRIYIGSQENPAVLREIANERGPFDIIIDDGGHTMRQQITSFQTLFSSLNDGGIYVIEDLHTSYWSEFGGGKNKNYTAVKMIKNLIDEMHYWAIQHPRRSLFVKLQRRYLKTLGERPANIFQSDIRSIYIADSICFIHKQRVEKEKLMKL
jgi:hypothetical protein